MIWEQTLYCYSSITRALSCTRISLKRRYYCRTSTHIRISMMRRDASFVMCEPTAKLYVLHVVIWDELIHVLWNLRNQMRPDARLNFWNIHIYRWYTIHIVNLLDTTVASTWLMLGWLSRSCGGRKVCDKLNVSCDSISHMHQNNMVFVRVC